MNPSLAIKHGSPTKPSAVFRNFSDPVSPSAELVRFMASDEAHVLEQEEFDPVIPIPGMSHFNNEAS